MAGCAVLQPDPVPSPPPPSDPALLAQDDSAQAFDRWLERDSSGRINGFRPLREAEAALADAEADTAAAQHAPAELAQAQAALTRTKKQWQAIRAEPLAQPQALAQAGRSAHNAQRLAEIAIAIGERERARSQ